MKYNKIFLLYFFIAIATTAMTYSCTDNVQRVEDKVYHAKELIDENESVEIKSTDDNSLTVQHVDDSIYPFGDSRLKKHPEYINSVLIETPNEWDIEAVRIVQDAKRRNVLDEGYCVSTVIWSGDLDGFHFDIQDAIFYEDVRKSKIEFVKKKQLEEINDKYKKIVYALTDLKPLNYE